MATVSQPTPTDELAAVNIMLGTIQEAPVNTLAGVQVTDVAVARNVLAEASRDVQTRGWHFNTEHSYPFYPNVDGEIKLGRNVLEIDFAPRADVDPVQRGNKLYDRKNHTYTFPAAVYCTTVVWHLPFDEITQAARTYATILAARRFQARTVGSLELEGFTRADLIRAKVNLENSDARNAGRNILTGSRSVSRVLRRDYSNVRR